MNKMTRICLIRKRRGLSQQQTADLMHISRRTYGEVERGVRAPSSRFLTRFSEVMDVSIAEILPDPGAADAIVRSQEEARILSLYRSLDRSGKEYIYQELLMESVLCGGI